MATASSVGKGLPPTSKRVKQLKQLKEYEVQRQRAFSKWMESAKSSIAVERERATSAQRLIAIVRAQVKDRSDVDAEYAKKLHESASSRSAKVATQFPKVSTWLVGDVQEAHYLSALQESCAKAFGDATKAAFAAIEGNQTLSRLEQKLGSPTVNLLEAEQALNALAGMDSECSQVFVKLEAAASTRDTLAAGKGATVDLWELDTAYRAAVVELDVRIRHCE
eukprot:414372-Amphidinium_carterae.1